MAEPTTLEHLLFDPCLSGFILRPGPATGSSPLWVLETTGPEDIEESRPGDIVVAGRQTDSEYLPVLSRACVAVGASALALPDDVDFRYPEMAVITYPSWIPRHGAAALLAQALWPLDASRRGSELALSATVLGKATSWRRVLAMASPTRIEESAERSGLAAIMAPYLPYGVESRALPGDSAETRYLLLYIDDTVTPAELRLSLRAAAEENRLSIGASDAFPSSGEPDAYASRAREALLLGTALFGGGHVSFYENLYLYKAFIDNGRPDILLSFSRDTLRLIREWDETHGSELLKTLETFFDLDRSFRRAADRLGIHRHTLKNRLQTIEEITACPVRGEGGMSYELILAYKHLSKVKL